MAPVPKELRLIHPCEMRNVYEERTLLRLYYSNTSGRMTLLSVISPTTNPTDHPNRKTAMLSDETGSSAAVHSSILSSAVYAL